MSNLLANNVKSGERPGILLYDLSGDLRPSINDIIIYKWRVQLLGSRSFSTVTEVSVSLSFLPEHLPLIIEDLIPRRQVEEKASLTLGSPSLPGLIPVPSVQVTVPIKDDRIKGWKEGPGKARWEFRSIKLPDALSEVIEGAVAIRYDKGSEDEHIRIAMNVRACFETRKWLIRKSSREIALTPNEVQDRCADIIPYDPSSLRGKASLVAPGKTRVIDYDWEIEKGLLKKGSILNVSLRRETLAMLFDKIREMILDLDKYEQIMKAAGQEIGVSFARDMKDKILHHNMTLDQWSDYDSSAGMGRFAFERKAGKIEKIIVTNSFIAQDGASDKATCYFLAGYFEGVLSVLYTDKIFSIFEEKCVSCGDSKCIFQVTEKDGL